MARKKPTDTRLTDQAVALADYGADALFAAGQLRIKSKPVEFPLSEDERATIADLPALPDKIRRKVKKDGTITVAETVSIVKAVADSIVEGDPLIRLGLLVSAKKLIDCLQSNIVPSMPIQDKQSKPARTVFQFKITLIEAKPPIWRRIQVKDCTLDKLHEHIQTSMGWTNSHLHKFQIGGKQYADPMLMEEDMSEFGYKDSTTTMLSKVMPKDGRPLRLRYEYDFGDSWEHEVLFEGCPKAEAGRQYPLCLEGERACPPEDIGGVWGYADFLKAIGNKKHKGHKEMLEWAGGWFDPVEFDPVTATKSMKKGLPDWRKELM